MLTELEEDRFCSSLSSLGRAQRHFSRPQTLHATSKTRSFSFDRFLTQSFDSGSCFDGHVSRIDHSFCSYRHCSGFRKKRNVLRSF